MNERLADVLDRAADYLEKHGWIQGQLRGYASPSYPNSDPVGVCATGAIEAVAELELDRVHARQELVSYLVTHELWPHHHVPHWNDMTSRTKQEVLDAVRACAKELRG